MKDRETLLALKQKEHAERGLAFDGNFYTWDYEYYDRKFIESSLDLDDMLVKEYFPVSVVVPAIIDIYQNLLGARFEIINGSIWHPGAFICGLASHRNLTRDRCPTICRMG
jgi:Zn-dependent oligopeptidase